MKTAIITGASAGLGLEFLKAAPKYFPDVDEFWLIARRKEKLEEAAALINKPCHILPLDLTARDSYTRLAEELAAKKPDVVLLINNSGCGFLGNVGEGDLDKQLQMVDLNLRGLTAVTHVVLPYMKEGGRIINVSSIASFCPNSRMTVYSAGKSYVTAFSYGIGEELRARKITSTAVCPGPMDTEFIYLGDIKGKSKTFDTLPYCIPEQVVRGSLRAAKKGKAVYTPKLLYKLYRVLSALLPNALFVKFAGT